MAILTIISANTAIGRVGQILIVAVLVGMAANLIVFAIRDWPLGDMDVYLEAARRLRDGEPLYVPGDVAVDSYWYAPWYAALWVPLTYLPREIVAIGWSALLLIASAAVSLLVWRAAPSGRILALFVGPALFAVSAGGNVQAPMLLALIVGFHRRWGPLAVAVAASMKFAPILLVVGYAARGEWRRAFASLALAAILIVPALPMGLLQGGMRSAAAPSLLGISPILYAIAVIVPLAAAFVLPRRFGVLAAATASVLALPRLYVYDVTLVALGTVGAEEPGGSGVSQPHASSRFSGLSISSSIHGERRSDTKRLSG